jgi:hypothetical protein
LTGQSDDPVAWAPRVKVVWFSGPADLPQLGDRITMLEARTTICNGQCPWLRDNQGASRPLYNDHEAASIEVASEPFDFGTWRRSELWDAELRDATAGYASLCHVRLKGTERRSDDSWHIVGRQCTGALVMQQRELLRFLIGGASALSPAGAAGVASAALDRPVTVEDLPGIPRRELHRALHPRILDPAIGCDAVGPPVSLDELAEWNEWLGRAEKPRQLHAPGISLFEGADHELDRN